jgi:4,5-DOPA dioxygenase extradiol
MNRKEFLQLMAAMPLGSSMMELKDIGQLLHHLPLTEKMPALFLGHGSPMNAIEDNEFVRGFIKTSKELPKPKAILCISAHWETKGTYLTASPQPKTIHDFGGFPPALYAVQYPAKGSPELALVTQQLITQTNVQLDHDWGLDHGAWSVLKHLYPAADIPVIQMSLDYSQAPHYHYELAKQIASLRNRGILVVGSGNMVHNLRLVDWKRLNENYAYDWATEVSEKMKNLILDNNHTALTHYNQQGKAFALAIPTPEHFLPLLYILALKEKNETVSFFNDKPVAGALSMTSIKIA